jgi:hypothetical protein
MSQTKVSYSMINGAPLNVLDFGAVGDGVADDTVAIQTAVDVANGDYVFFPNGTYRITDSITRLTSTTETFIPGMKLIGEGLNTIIKIDANNKPALLWDVGYVPDGTTTPTLKFTRDSEVTNLAIQQASGRTGCDGMKLTAAWNLRMTNVWITGMSGQAINVPFRSDIYAVISDFWQCFAFEINQCRFSECTGWGLYFGGGQSPGLWTVKQCTIANNAAGGIYTSQGQFELVDSLIVGCGTFGVANSGGMFVDVVEGPQYVAYIARNEFDTNYNFHFSGYRLESWKVEANRFLSSTFSATTGGTIVATGGFMRPAIHLSLGANSPAGYYPINSLFTQNFHRSTPTSAETVTCYSTGGALNRNLFANNQIDAPSNSSGVARFAGTVLTEGTNSVIQDQVALFGQPYFRATSSSATAVPNTGSPATVLFNTVSVSGGGYSSSVDTTTGIFTAPEAGLYQISAIVGFDSATATEARVGFGINGATMVSQSMASAGALNTPILQASTLRLLAKGDTVRVLASHTSAGSVNTLTTQAQAEFAVYKIPNS